MDYYERIKQITKLSDYDDAYPYEVDQGGIYIDKQTGKFIWLTASGCSSCWDGDYREEQFDDLDSLIKHIDADESTYSPSLETRKRLKQEAVANFKAAIDLLATRFLSYKRRGY